MRYCLAATVVLVMSSLFSPALAGNMEDCAQEEDLNLSVTGCTKVIKSGKVSGGELARTFYYRGNAHRRLGNIDSATEDLNQAVRFDPTFKRTYIDRGIIYSKAGEYARAIEEYDKALRIDPKFPKAYYNRGNVYWRLDQFDRAIANYDKAIKYNPKYYFPYVGRSWALYSLGRDTEALLDAERALSFRPGNNDVLFIRALIFAALGRQEEALAEFDQLSDAKGPHWVETMQNALKSAGHYKGKVDGKYGPETRAALMLCLKVSCRLFE